MTRLFFTIGALAAGFAAGPSYVAPRTAWGAPDLQGTYTNKYEANTPLERPEAFAGRRLEEVSAAELAVIREQRQKQFLERPAAVGPLQFRDPLDVNRGSRAWFLVDPPDGRIPPRTPAELRRIGRYDASFEGTLDTGLGGVMNSREGSRGSFGDGPFDSLDDFTLWDRCITRGLPGAMMPHILGNSYQIVQAPGLVAIRYELVHDTRVIPVDGRPHVGRGIELEMGDARGHWEGSTLVIETTNFKDRSTYRNAHATTLRLVERFTRTAPNRLEWAVTLDDSATWTRPWTFSMPLTMDDGEPVMEFACHEGNYAVPHILSGARAEDDQLRASARAAVNPN
jgi:hypothetical protein